MIRTISQSVVNIFTEISHADRGTIIMKHTKRDFLSNACVPPPWMDLGVGSKGQNSTFSEHGHVAYQIKENHECSSVVAYILHAYTYPPYLGIGIKRSKFNFFFRTWSCCILN